MTSADHRVGQLALEELHAVRSLADQNVPASIH